MRERQRPTPAPWYTVHLPENPLLPYAIRTINDDTIALVCDDQLPADANAELIAEAPNLLHAGITLARFARAKCSPGEPEYPEVLAMERVLSRLGVEY